MKIFSILFISLAILGPSFSEDRVHTKLQLFINNHTFGKTNGCLSGVGIQGDVTCGHADSVSRVTWKWVESDGLGDKYEFTRYLTSNLKKISTDTVTVVYKGKEIQLWKDSKQRIAIRPFKGTAKRANLTKELRDSISGRTGTPSK